MDPLHAAQPAAEPDITPVVLVVEDDPSAQAAIVRLLEAHGFDVQTAQDGLEGFAAVGRSDFNVIVCDVRMPGLGGMGFFQQLEETYPTFARRVIFVTAYTGAPDVMAFIKLTGQPFFQKPFELRELVEAVRAIADRPLFRRSTMTDPGHLDPP